MATIACLGWESLVWDARELPIQRKWHEDGPFLKVEFTRQSSDGRITLVIVDDAGTLAVCSLWAVMAVETVDAARDALRRREGIGEKHKSSIGDWSANQQAPLGIPTITDWAKAHGVDAVVWTALPPKLGGKDFAACNPPSEDQILSYLAGLRGATRDDAERYIRLAPRQIDTPYRRRIEADLGWSALDSWPPTGR